MQNQYNCCLTCYAFSLTLYSSTQAWNSHSVQLKQNDLNPKFLFLASLVDSFADGIPTQKACSNNMIMITRPNDRKLVDFPCCFR